MELKHYLNNTEIDEPIGFDALKVTMTRGDYHGISAEISVGSLEFYGTAAGMIRDAYDSNIDADLEYLVTDEDGTELYRGKVDLTTYSEQQGEYCSVSCKVGEIGIKTLFNNRSETEIDLNTIRSVDGSLLTYRPHWWTMYLPTKQLCHTDRWSQNVNKSIVNPATGAYWSLAAAQRVFFALSTIDKSEFGSADNGAVGAPIYTCSDTTEFVNEFGSGCVIKADGSLRISYIFTPTLASGWNSAESGVLPSVGTWAHVIRKSVADVTYARYDGNGNWKDEEGEVHADILAWSSSTNGSTAAIRLRVGMFYSRTGAPVSSKEVVVIPQTYTQGSTESVSLDFNGLSADPTRTVYFGIQTVVDYNVIDNISYYFVLLAGARLRFRMYDTIQLGSTTALCVSVGDALETIAQSITENGLHVRSDYYGLPEDTYQDVSAIGGGAMRFLTNGYKIRHLFTDSTKTRSMPQSFRSIMEALSVLDCAGWGFFEENGTVCVRVERWDWFYKNEVVLELENAGELKREAEPGCIVSGLTIGYQKYETQQDYDSIDTIHGVRNYTSGIKAVSNNVSKLCAWIADNYAIEATRRAERSCDRTEEFKYDSNIFVFEGMKLAWYNYAIAKSAENVVGIDRPDELINATLSPRHCAARWKDFLYQANSTKTLKFSSGTNNCEASFSVKESEGNNHYCQSFADNDPQVENEAIELHRSILMADSVKFEYPISAAQYAAVKANPYGKVKVDGITGWIQEFSYSFVEGVAEFTIIPEAN